MTLIDIVALAASNLWRRKMRTFLTVLGVIIGTSCIVLMVALGLGNLEQFKESIMQSNNLTQITISPRGSGEQAKLTDSRLAQLRALPGVKNATGVINIPSYILLDRYKADTSVIAVDPSAMGFKFMEGKVFSESPEIELVVGANARQSFIDPRKQSSAGAGGDMYDMGMGGMMAGVEGEQEMQGPDIKWTGSIVKYYPGNASSIENTDPAKPDEPKPKEYRGTISGVLEKADSEQSYNIYMSLQAAQKLIRENRQMMANQGVKEGEYSQGYVNAVDVDSVESVLKEVKQLGLQAYSPTEWIKQMQQEQERQQSQLVAIGLISLLVSAIGIANTMLASILERSREIGVMKVIGLGISKINLMFLVESAMIGLIGGMIGLGISYILSAFTNFGGGEMNFLGMYFQNGMKLVIPWWLALGAAGISGGVGILSGLYPARKATKMSPLEAIRSAS